MKKISEIAQSLGLTESQIGLYIRENLIHPSQDAGKHFKSGVLTGSEVQQLQAVQCLRVHEFGLEEIKYLTICGEAFHDYLRQKSEKKMVLYSNQEDVLSAVAALQSHAPEGKEREKLNREVRRFRGLPQEADRKPTFLQKYGSVLALSVIMLILLAVLFLRLDAPAARVMAVLALFAIGGLIAFVSSIVYLVRRKPPKAYSCRREAVIEKIDRVAEFDTSFAMGRSIVPGAGFREQGQGGIWQFVFMFWNEIRPDHYFPILKFSLNGTERIATFRFGGFRHSWRRGDTIPVYCSEKDDGIVYPEDTAYMAWKSLLALCAAAVLCGIFFLEIGPVFRAASSTFTVLDMHQILFGMEEDAFKGTEQISDSEILLDFSYFTGTKKLGIECRKGDFIYVETEDALDDSRLHLLVDMKAAMGRMIADQRVWDEHQNISKTVYSIARDGTYYLNAEAYQASGRIHAVVFRGKDAAEAAGSALDALASSQTLALKATSTIRKETAAETVSTLFCDQGRCYLRTEENTGDGLRIREMLYDGNAGWIRTRETEAQAAEWTQSSAVSPEPELLAVLRQYASGLMQESALYEGVSYLEGCFSCYFSDAYLENLEKETGITGASTGNLYIKIDESSGKATYFQMFHNFTEEQEKKTISCENLFVAEALEDASPAQEIETHLAELKK